MTVTADRIHEAFATHGQGHVFAEWDRLNAEQRSALLEDCAYVDWDWLDARLADLQRGGADAHESPMMPAPVIALPETDAERAAEAEARACGEEALRAGKLAAFLVAGGQGTRLGFDGPKGCFPLGPNTGRTLFQWHAEQIKARAERYGTVIPWYIMTSRANHAATEAFFVEHDWFGLGRENVMLFEQAMVPSVDMNGKLMLSTAHGLALNPDGHGGSLRALVRSGAVADMQRRGITTVSYFQVDNPLTTICDPVFAGYHLEAGAQMSSKVVRKSDPDEKVGHVCLIAGKTTVIEYSDIDEANKTRRDADGELTFWAGSIAIHMLDVAFIDRVGGGAELPWHIAKKAIPVWNGTESVKPGEPNGIKFETFVFDALPLTDASVTMEVAREEEFAPVKNASGIDSAESCCQLLSNRFAGWLEPCGVHVPRGAEGNSLYSIEIAPILALDAAQLRPHLPVGLAEIEAPLTLE